MDNTITLKYKFQFGPTVSDLIDISEINEEIFTNWYKSEINNILKFLTENFLSYLQKFYEDYVKIKQLNDTPERLEESLTHQKIAHLLKDVFYNNDSLTYNYYIHKSSLIVAISIEKEKFMTHFHRIFGGDLERIKKVLLEDEYTFIEHYNTVEERYSEQWDNTHSFKSDKMHYEWPGEYSDKLYMFCTNFELLGLDEED